MGVDDEFPGGAGGKQSASAVDGVFVVAAGGVKNASKVGPAGGGDGEVVGT